MLLKKTIMVSLTARKIRRNKSQIRKMTFNGKKMRQLGCQKRWFRQYTDGAFRFGPFRPGLILQNEAPAWVFYGQNRAEKQKEEISAFVPN